MKNNSITFAFLTVLVISLVIASTPAINPNTPLTTAPSLNSKTNGQGDLITVPESTNPVTLDGIITAQEWSDAYSVTLTLYNYTGYQWDAQFWIKYNASHILMAENVSNPAVNPTGPYMFLVGIINDLFMIYGQDIIGVVGVPGMGTYMTLDMFQAYEQDPEFDTDFPSPGTNDTIGETDYDGLEGPSAEWIRPRYTYDDYDFNLGTGLLFFVRVGYNDGYQSAEDPAMVQEEDILMFTLGRVTVPYSTTPVDFDGDIDVTVEWKDALYLPSIELFNSTYSWNGNMWVKFNYTHLLVAMNVTYPMTYGNFSFLGLFENLLDFTIGDYSSDLFGILGNNTNTLTETQDQYLFGPPDGPMLLPDTFLGGTNDTYGVTYYDAMIGPRAEFCHPLNSGDLYDEAIQAGSTILGMAGYGDGLWNANPDSPPALSFSAALVLEEPVIDGPSDITYEEGETGYSITWHPRALNHHVYNVTQDVTVLESDFWDGGDITIDVDGFSVGTYIFTCSVNSTYGDSTSDSVTVEVTPDITPPNIDEPADITYEEGETGYSITWKPRDANPHMYNVTMDGVLVPGYSGVWDGRDITINVDGLDVGTYIFVCSVNDTAGRSATNSVTVTVTPETTPPNIDEPADITYEEGETGYSITWKPRDANPHMYNVTMDGVLVPGYSGVWDGNDITLNLDDLSLTVGTYIFVCSVNDTNGNSVSDEVTVTVTAPEEVSEFSYGYAFIALVALPLIALITYRKTKKLRT